MEIYARHAQIYQRHVPCNLHPNASAAAAAAAAAGLRGQYAGQNDGQDVNVVTQTHTHTNTCMCWRIRFLMFWGLALKNALPSSSSSHSKKLLEIFLALFLTMPRYARHAKAMDVEGERRGQANRSARVGAVRGRARVQCALVFRGRIDW